MFLYMISLIVGLFGTAALTYAFCRSLDRNYGRRNKRPISYLAPVFLSLLLIYFSIDYTMPRFFDLIPLISKDYEVLEFTASEEQIRWTSLMIDDKPYYYNRFQYKPAALTSYKLTALPNSRHVIALETMSNESTREETMRLDNKKIPMNIYPGILPEDMRGYPSGPIRMVVFDLDGTVLNEARVITRRNRQAVLSLREAGIEYTLASGRTELQMRLYAEELDVRLPIIACNGAVAYDHRTDESLFRRQMSEPLIVETIDFLIKNRIDFMGYSADSVFYPDYGRKIDVMRLYNERAQASGSRLIRTQIVNGRVKEAAAIGMVKILAMAGDRETQKKVLDIVTPHHATIVASMADAMDIMAPDVSKGAGMAALAEIEGIALNEVIAFGDHDNDASMLAMAGTGIAMGQATKECLAVADLVAPSGDDDGVAIAIESYILPRINRFS